MSSSIQNSTYLELINAGKVNIFLNDSLKIAIINLYREYDAAAKHFEGMNLTGKGVLQNWIQDIIDIKYRPISADIFDNDGFYHNSEWEWINDPESKEFKRAEQTVGFYAAKHKTFINYFQKLLLNVKEVSDLIRTELREEVQTR